MSVHNLICSLNCLIQVKSVRLRQWKPCYGSLNVCTFFDSPSTMQKATDILCLAVKYVAKMKIM